METLKEYIKGQLLFLETDEDEIDERDGGIVEGKLQAYQDILNRL